MLSILIPIYNYDATLLVTTLHRQATSADVNFEILLLDDASDNTDISKKNSDLASLKNVCIEKLPTKAGRSVARNFLAGKAHYPYLLFLDCDSETIDDQFINRYLPFLGKENVVVCGGTAYKEKKPDADSYLRWIYGIKCEEKSAEERGKTPYAKFSAFNFLIDKKLFCKIRFNEMLKNYGHEDTMFGIELQKENYPIIHIDNPLYHTGIDTNSVYIKKTEQGVENLKILLEQYVNKDLLIENIRLLRYYNYLEKSHTTGLVAFGFHTLKTLMFSNFYSKHPSLTLFNLYKLGYLCHLKFRKHYEF